MKKTLCVSVRLESLISISDKAFKARSFNGSEDILPKSCIFGRDLEAMKSEAYWIASWILPTKNIQYSNKKKCWIDEKGNKLPIYQVEHHTPEKVITKGNNHIKELER